MDTVKAILAKRREIPGAVGLLSGTVAFTLLIAMGAFVFIPLPFTPVPITMQVLFVLLAGLVLGKRHGTLSVLLYIVVGTMGVPVFAGAVGGIARIFGPTGGYLLGFLLAPCMVSFLYTRFKRGLGALVVSLYAGLFAIYICGALQLALFLDASLGKAIQIGVFPFILGDTLKIILVIYVVQLTRRSSWSFLSSFRK